MSIYDIHAMISIANQSVKGEYMTVTWKAVPSDGKKSKFALMEFAVQTAIKNARDAVAFPALQDGFPCRISLIGYENLGP